MRNRYHMPMFPLALAFVLFLAMFMIGAGHLVWVMIAAWRWLWR
jgi:hypothetical protein